MNTGKKKLLFVFPSKSSFQQIDKEILSDEFKVIENFYNWKNKLLYPFYLLHQFFFLLLTIKQYSVIIISFGGYWSFLPSFFAFLFKIPSFLIVHGTDTISFPEFKFGLLRKYLPRLVVKQTIKFVDNVLPVSKSLIYTANNYIHSDKTIYQGLKFHFPNIDFEHKVIPNGIKIAKWFCDENKKKEFVTLLYDSSWLNKGGNEYMLAAEHFPNYTFHIIGSSGVNVEKRLPNVIFHGIIPQSKMRSILSRSQYYVQLSFSEGFGCTLCEAMLCECVPLVSKVNIMPDIVGNSGIVVDNRSESEIVHQFDSALNTDQNSLIRKGKQGRQRIIENYSFENRKQLLLETLTKSN